MHLVVDVLPLGVEPLQDLGQHIDCLLAAEPRALGLELLQQVLGGHGLADEVTTYGLFRQLHVAVRQGGEGVELGAESAQSLQQPMGQ